MKRIITLLMCILMVALSFTSCGGSGASGSKLDDEPYVAIDEASQAVYDQFKDQDITIDVYNWGQYISEGDDGYIDVNKEFTAATGIKVNYITFDSNESMYTKLKTGGTNFDVIIPSDYMIGRLIDEGMLEELDFANIPNYSKVDDAYKNTGYDPDNKYSVPYTWGTVGLIYNSAYIEEAPTSWSALWNEEYDGKVLMFGNQRDAFAIAEKLLGYSLNETDETILEECTKKLEEQKPLVQQYVMDEIYDAMIYEEAWIAPYYAGDFLQMKVDNEDLEFVFPEEGFNLYIDACCIPKGALHKAAAEAYINFLCTPQVSGENLEYIGYSTPISEAKKYMDEEMTVSPIAYPSEDILSRGEAFNFLGGETTQLMDSLFTRVKAS